MSSGEGLGREVTEALGYLLKHAHLQLDAALTGALAPLELDPRALGVLRVVASREPTSQQEIARLLSVDRTTMVALLDALEAKGIIARRPQAGDRRRNVVDLTDSGRDIFVQAEKVATETERQFLASVTTQDAQHFRATLHAIVTQTSGPAPHARRTLGR